MLTLLAALVAVAGPAPPPITGGTDVAQGQAGPVVAILDDRGAVYCSGVLIADDRVLTAAHCHQRAASVRLEAVTLDEGGVEVVVVDSAAAPGGIDRPDAAVLTLGDAVQTQPALLLDECGATKLQAGQVATVYGWGATDAEGTAWTTHLQLATVEIDDPECADADAGCNQALHPTGELIAKGAGRDACIGDSGGPLWVQTDSGLAVAAIVSRGIDDVGSPFCGDGGIYTRVGALHAWLEHDQAVTVAKTPCPQAAAPRGCASVPHPAPAIGMLWMLASVAARRRRLNC